MRFSFADHTLDADRRELRRDSEPVAVEPQVWLAPNVATAELRPLGRMQGDQPRAVISVAAAP